MTNYHWIIAQHSGKVLEVKDGSLCSSAEIFQRSKKSELDPNVDMQLWYFNGGFIVNKRSGFVLDVVEAKCQNGTKIVQYQKHDEPSRSQEWDTTIRTILSILNLIEILSLMSRGLISSTCGKSMVARINNSFCKSGMMVR
ncbi:hypothetical protein RhiirA4_449856, partial [Rhizophagus irregularis]